MGIPVSGGHPSLCSHDNAVVTNALRSLINEAREKYGSERTGELRLSMIPFVNSS